ncbi:unnamed protein product [Medioppia subpectinata]|uniref:Uncharacterized protein n=1 Tax=Medioppia subpectinata TaxID=1979941 RepID=A0A7R9KGF1_9ACAR|nr:unnamed protein product [Medioppia subpectinata]CAG2103078.1 unnamed protein product [Medioppia subpectinata]
MYIKLTLATTIRIDHEPVYDKNTHEPLPIMTNRYYAIRNVKTHRFLVWFGPNSTIPVPLDTNDPRIYHTLTKDCHGGESPNGEYNYGFISCNLPGEYKFGSISWYIPDYKNDHNNNVSYQEFNWEFIERPGPEYINNNSDNNPDNNTTNLLK